MLRSPVSARIPATLVLLLLSLLFCVNAPARAQPARTFGNDPGLEHLAQEVTRLAGHAKGTVGVAAYHVETERGFTLNGDVPFPMASTYKVPIAVQVLSMVDRGELALADLVEVMQAMSMSPPARSATSWTTPGSKSPSTTCSRLMLQISDNIATDLLMRTAGTSSAVTAKMTRSVLTGSASTVLLGRSSPTGSGLLAQAKPTPSVRTTTWTSWNRNGPTPTSSPTTHGSTPTFGTPPRRPPWPACSQRSGTARSCPRRAPRS